MQKVTCMLNKNMYIFREGGRQRVEIMKLISLSNEKEIKYEKLNVFIIHNFKDFFLIMGNNVCYSIYLLEDEETHV